MMMMTFPKGISLKVPVTVLLVWFGGISTLIGCLMPNPIHTYILDI